jgi:hypothetical protein
LLVADARNAAAYARLLQGEVAEMGIHDPPYNVRIQGNVGGRGRIKRQEFVCASGEMSSAQFTDFLKETLGHCARHSADGSISYVFMDWRHIGASGVSFVSVTQAFNTTSSMGRLTLNVLLSFAQFEREVTGERIRDKIAASKKKGLWMGGFVPFGYRSKERTLIIHADEAATVRTIFARYLELGNVPKLEAELCSRNLRTRAFTSATNKAWGNRPFSRGHLYRILSNPVYAGKIAHRDERYDGQHEAVVDPKVFHAVQAQLAANTRQHKTRSRAKESSLLAFWLMLMAPSSPPRIP